MTLKYALTKEVPIAPSKMADYNKFANIAMRTVTASISFVGSTTIAFVIIKMPHGLSSSYRRIILCLSIADVIQSLSIILGPFAVPQDTPDSIWAIGNTASCTTQGFLLNIASVATPMYTFGLSIYFLLRVKYGMSREDFATVVEWKWHTVILLWNLVGNSYTLFTKSINASRAGSLCHIDGLPLLCDVDPEKYGECIRGENALRTKSIVIYIPILVCFLGMGISLGILTWHVFAQESKKDEHSQESLQEEEHANDDTMFAQESKKHSQEQAIQEEEVENDDSIRVRVHTSTKQISSNGSLENPLSMARTYRKEMLTQSCLYMFGYLFIRAFLLINQLFIIAGLPYPDWSHMAISLTWPLGGFINILVYTRPKIAILRIRQPQLSWTKAFCTIILAGAEVPDESPDFPPPRPLPPTSSLLRQNFVVERESKAEDEDSEKDDASIIMEMIDSFINRPNKVFGIISEGPCSLLPSSHILWSEKTRTVLITYDRQSPLWNEEEKNILNTNIIFGLQ
jgi:hypothetical protein